MPVESLEELRFGDVSRRGEVLQTREEATVVVAARERADSVPLRIRWLDLRRDGAGMAPGECVDGSRMGSEMLSYDPECIGGHSQQWRVGEPGRYRRA